MEYVRGNNVSVRKSKWGQGNEDEKRECGDDDIEERVLALHPSRNSADQIRALRTHNIE